MECQKTVTIVSDSFLTPFRLKHSGIKNSIKIRGHQVAPHDNEVRIVNLAKGGHTFRKILSNKDLLQSWIESKPTVSLIHLGPVDIVNKEIQFTNKDLSIGQVFKDVLVDFVNKLEEVAKNFLKNNFNSWQSSHTFILCALPDWRNYTKKYKYCLDPVDYRFYRKRINKFLNRNIGKLLRENNILVVAPGTENAEYSGVHLVATSQRIYNEKILNAVKKVLCPACAPDPTWPKKDFHRQNFTTDKFCRGSK